MKTEEKRPVKEANRITKLLDIGLLGAERFPVDVQRIAIDLTPEFNPDPITAVKGGSMGKVDGVLVRHDSKDEWAIFYNTDVAHQGRKNFTLAHELGHYMVHRHVRSSGRFECGESDILGEDQNASDIEAEANAFAANLLMPNNDFRKQVENQEFSFDLMAHCASRYEVSLTAAVLKWLLLTPRRALALLSEDGYMHWSTSSQKAFKTGRYFATKKGPPLEIPHGSLASEERFTQAARSGARLAPGIWFSNESVIEHSVYSEEYGKTLTVLILEDDSGYSDPDELDGDSELLTDSYAHIIKNGRNT